MKRLAEEQKPYKMIEAGYQFYTGHIATECEAQILNRIAERMNAFILDGWQVPEQLLNGHHNMVQTIALQDRFVTKV